MAKLKIISQSLPTRCEVCHQTDQFDAKTGYCSRCFVVIVEENPFINLSKIENNEKISTKNKKISKPKEVTLEVNNNGVTISYNTFDKDTIFGLILFLLVAIGLLYAEFYSIGLMLALTIVYILPATILNTRVIKVDKDKIDVWEGPLPMGINKEIKVNLIKHISYEKNALGDYKLQALLIKNDNVEILPNIINKKIAKFLKKQIEKYLDIPEEPVTK